MDRSLFGLQILPLPSLDPGFLRSETAINHARSNPLGITLDYCNFRTLHGCELVPLGLAIRVFFATAFLHRRFFSRSGSPGAGRSNSGGGWGWWNGERNRGGG